MGVRKKIKRQKINLTEDKAYVLGLLFGEASLYKEFGRNYFSIAQKNRQVLVNLSKFIEKLYGKKFKIKIPTKSNHRNLFQVYIYGKNLIEDLERFSKGFGHKKWGLNKKGFLACWNNPNIAAYYIRGILDGEGKKPRKRGDIVDKETVIGSKNLDGLFQIMYLLEKHWNMIPVIFEVNNKKYYHLRISGEDFIKLAKGTKIAPSIGFYHPERKEALKKAIGQKIKLKQYPSRYFLEAWRLRIDKGLGHIRIAKMLGIKESAVGYWIYLRHRPFEIQKIAKRLAVKIDGKHQITPYLIKYLTKLILPTAKNMEGSLAGNVQFLLDRILGLPIKTRYWARKGKYSEDSIKNAIEFATILRAKGYNKLTIARYVEQKYRINVNTFRKHFMDSV